MIPANSVVADHERHRCLLSVGEGRHGCLGQDDIVDDRIEVAAEFGMRAVDLVELLGIHRPETFELPIGGTDRQRGEVDPRCLGRLEVERRPSEVQPAATVARALCDRPVEEPASTLRGHEVEHRFTASRFPEDRDLVRVTTERRNVVAYPLERGDLVEQAVVARHTIG
jgi:hypothetical protein